MKNWLLEHAHAIMESQHKIAFGHLVDGRHPAEKKHWLKLLARRVMLDEHERTIQNGHLILRSQFCTLARRRFRLTTRLLSVARGGHIFHHNRALQLLLNDRFGQELAVQFYKDVHGVKAAFSKNDSSGLDCDFF